MVVTSKFVLFVLGAGAVVGGWNSASSENSQFTSSNLPINCGIQSFDEDGATILKGFVFSDISVSGTYWLQVENRSSGGTSKSQQSGRFFAEPGEPTILGNIVLGNGSSSHDATLRITTRGNSYECSTSKARSI